MKTFSLGLDLDHEACKGCMRLNEVKKNTTLHFTCPQDKSQKCMRCSINPQKQNECKLGCFTIVNENSKPCLIQKDYNKIFKNRQYVKSKKASEKNGNSTKSNTNTTSTPEPAKSEDSKSQVKEIIEKAQKEIFIVKPVEQDVLFFLIDSSGSMASDTKICDITLTDSEWLEYVNQGKYVPRITVVKEVLKKKIDSFPDKQKYFIWESSGKKIYENLDGTKTKDQGKAFIDSILPGGVFYYEEAFKALISVSDKLNKSNAIVSLLTDGGITNEKPADSGNLKTILEKGVKKWELFLYSEGGCTDPQTQEQEKIIMEALKKKVGL